MNIKTEEVILRSAKVRCPDGKSQTVCDIFSYQPDNIEQMPLGNLYIVAELSDIKDCGHLNNLLASLIKREYYLHPSKGAFPSLQSALSKANLHLKDSANQGNLEWLGKFHFICAAINEDGLFLTQAGNSKAFLCRQNHLANLSRKIIPESEKPHPSKIFSSIVSGKVEPADKIILATPVVDELFSPAGLRQVLISQPTLSSISDQINKTLREQNKRLQIAILLLQAEADEIFEQHPCQSPETPKAITPPIDLSEILR
ncbi:MAG: hypothetical protein HY764_04275 [Candidatus Portnoybacteria bacterium]|nr:hypothetical protein [Candidatus Portnoybacteria bacterium]